MRNDLNDFTAEENLRDRALPLAVVHHLLPHFKNHELRQITVAEVDRYREAKQREGRLSAGQINKTITRLGQILDVAHERELIDRNPVRVNPRRRKAKASRPKPSTWTGRRGRRGETLLASGKRLDAPDRTRTCDLLLRRRLSLTHGHAWS